jgi:F-type H+-transporting ATPase subunit b
LLLANTLTFFLVLWILRKFAFRPIMNVLDQRQTTVNAGLDAAKRSTDELAAIQKDKAEVLKAAKAEALAIVTEAKHQGEAVKAKLSSEAQAEASATLTRTKQLLAREREAMIAQAKRELADVVVMATGKVLDATLDTKAKNALQKEAVKALKETQE